jgi:hypothetical protein
MRFRFHVVAAAFALVTVSLGGCRFPETKMVAVPPTAGTKPATSPTADAQAIRK